MKPKKKKITKADGEFSKYPRHTKKSRTTDEEGPLSPPVGMKKIHQAFGKYHRRYTTVDYGLLRRMLKASSGRPWNDVYSELCVSFSTPDSRRLLEDALKSCVLKQVTIWDDGTITHNQLKSPIGEFWSQFYIHPETGTLEYCRKKRQRKVQDPKLRVLELDDQLYHKHNNLWYRVEMTELPRKDYRYGYYEHNYWDQFSKDANAGPWESDRLRALTNAYGRSPNGNVWYCSSKENASKSEIKRLNKKYSL